MVNFPIYKSPQKESFVLHNTDMLTHGRNVLHYCKVTSNYEWSPFRQGIYCHNLQYHSIFSLWSHSEKVWVENQDTGEVHLMKDRFSCTPEHTINNNETLRKEFMWVKLSAKELSQE